MNDLISRQAAIDIERNATVDTNPSHFEAHQKFTQFMDDAEISSFGRWQWSNGFNTALTAVGIDLKKLPSAQPKQQWIPCSEKLPEINQTVLLSTTDGEVIVGYRYKPDIVWQVTANDGRKIWVYDPENYSGNIDELPKAETCGFEDRDNCWLSVTSINYDKKFAGISAWMPLPEPYKEDDKMKDDAISRRAVLKLLSTMPPEEAITKAMLIQNVKYMSAAQPEKRTEERTETHACDCISRQAAIDALGERPMVWAGSDYELGARNQYDADVLAIETVPSAQPETHDKRTEKHACDCISRRAAIDATWFEPSYTDPLNVLTEVRDRLKVLPSAQPKSYREGYQAGVKDAQPERKTGKWEIYVISMFDGEGCRCSECGLEGVSYWDFCPNCGADMRGGENG